MRSLVTARLVLLGAAIAIVASCAPILPPLTPEAQKTRGAYDGYSLLPPQGSDWAVGKVTPQEQMYIRRPPDQPQYSAIFQASIKRMPVTLRSYEELRTVIVAGHKYQDAQAAPGRFKNQSYTYAPDPTYPQCVRYRLESDDYQAANRESLPFLHLVGLTLACPHPDRPGLIVIVEASQRAPASVGTGDFERWANAFLAGFKFEK